jgi:hypothetical protein
MARLGGLLPDLQGEPALAQKIAIVHDWRAAPGGAKRVLSQMGHKGRLLSTVHDKKDAGHVPAGNVRFHLVEFAEVEVHRRTGRRQGGSSQRKAMKTCIPAFLDGMTESNPEIFT